MRALRSEDSSNLKGDRCFVCRDGERIVGCVDFVYRKQGSRGKLPNHVHCKNMFVSPDYRRRGIGSKLMESVVDFAASNYRENDSIDCLTLEVDDDNPNAIALYRKVGFGSPISVGQFSAKKQYGTFVVGRSIMINEIQ